MRVMRQATDNVRARRNRLVALLLVGLPPLYQRTLRADDHRYRRVQGGVHRPDGMDASMNPSSRITAAEWEAWFREECRAGRPPDALNRRIENEWERFISRIISGVDGHAYWPSERNFVRNDGGTRKPAYYWIEHIRGPIEDRAVIKPTCGELHCIAPPHQRVVSWSEVKMRYTDAQCIGALQLAAMRLGFTPTEHGYRDLGLKPEGRMIAARFGGWDAAVRVACLPPAERKAPSAFSQRWSDDDLVAALRGKVAELGSVPSGRWWDLNGVVPSRHTLSRRFGGWRQALEAAGLA